ncbi:hypothetical protein [Dictyobacter formicarum]|uniref:Uncharacterized protein n=1 Tax=Dictyobacter formicarum TaxID=2778368 RepID=A0ABQ3VDK1_9CHLR|nr:hypothetical protein [Dictyobacter formicarum]GHO84040.1 hypothetical protein KSZ_20460 [Dictyobacter formicarum]
MKQRSMYVHAWIKALASKNTSTSFDLKKAYPYSLDKDTLMVKRSIADFL